MLSEVEVGETVFTEYYVPTCYEASLLMLVDTEVMDQWPDDDYDELAYAMTRVSEDAFVMEIAVNKGEADGADIPPMIVEVFSANDCQKLDESLYHSVVERFRLVGIEGLTDIYDILSRAEHLSKIYAR